MLAGPCATAASQLVPGPGATAVEAPGGVTGLAPADGVAAQWSETVDWGTQGYVSCLIRPSRELRMATGDAIDVPIVTAPHLQAVLREHARHCEMHITMPGVDGNTYRGVLQVSHLRADRWYHVAITWDTEQPWLRAYVDGLDGGDLFHWKKGKATPLPPQRGELSFGGVAGDDQSRCAISIAAADCGHTLFNPEQLAVQLDDWDLPAIIGEVRSLDLPGIDLTGWRPELIELWDDPTQIISTPERELCEGDKRVRMPTTPWVFEGEGHTEVIDDGLRLVVADPTNRGLGHVVFWRDRVFPENLLVEYDIRPHDPMTGLHILFFAYRGTDGGSIFDLHQQRRGGRFKNYTKSTCNGYHGSVWSGDDQESRLTANLRKNSGFMMPAVGTDRIAEVGEQRWYTVRLAKIGGQIRFEVDGRSALAFDDDGETYGPVWTDGYLGWRIMAHTVAMDVRNIRISELVAE